MRPNQQMYWVWAAMVQRCCNPNNPAYPRYGGRGVKVCEAWRGSFAAFAADMGPRPAEGMTIERVDGDGDYSPSNCVWATRRQQNRNRPTWCRYVSINQERITLKEAWERFGDPSVTYRSFVKRIVTRGWDVERALRTRARKAA